MGLFNVESNDLLCLDYFDLTDFFDYPVLFDFIVDLEKSGLVNESSAFLNSYSFISQVRSSVSSWFNFSGAAYSSLTGGTSSTTSLIEKFFATSMYTSWKAFSVD